MAERDFNTVVAEGLSRIKDKAQQAQTAFSYCAARPSAEDLEKVRELLLEVYNRTRSLCDVLQFEAEKRQ